MLDRSSTTPILAWSVFTTSTPLTMMARTSITITLHSIRGTGSNIVRTSRITTLKVSTAVDIGSPNYPPSISGGTLRLLADVLEWTMTFREMLTLRFVKMA